MMNPYQLNWPGLRDVPVVTIETETGNIYSQENLLPLKRGKLDRIEYKYVPIEAVLDEFNAEIELEEAFETLTSILEIPGVKSLYTDKSTGRKYVHVSSLLALIVVRPEDGPGFEMACNGILHFLTNHMEMACLECGYIRRDCLCQDFDICYDRSNIECVSFVKQTMDKNIQTDPVLTDAGNRSVDTGSRPGASATTVYLPPGANLTDCERLPDGRLNIRYITSTSRSADTMGDIPLTTQARTVQQPPPAMVSSLSASGMPTSIMLPPVGPYPLGTAMQAGFLPPVCHTGMHSGMLSSNPYLHHLPPPTLPIGSVQSMMPGHMHLPSTNSMAYPGSNPFTNMRTFQPYSMPPVVSTVGNRSLIKTVVPPPPPTPVSKEGHSLKKRSPTPTGNNPGNGIEGKRKRKNGTAVNNFKENQLKVKMNFKNSLSSKEELKPVPAKRMKKPKATNGDEGSTSDKKGQKSSSKEVATSDKSEKSPGKENEQKPETSLADGPLKKENGIEDSPETLDSEECNKAVRESSGEKNSEDTKKKKVPTATLR